MNRIKYFGRVFAVLALGLLLGDPASATQDNNQPRALKSGTFDDDFFASGDTVIINNELEQDLYVAGGKVQVYAPVIGDVFAVGGEMNLAERINGSLLAVGGKFSTRGGIGGDAVVFGGELLVDSKITGDGLFMGGKIDINRPITGNLRAGGGKVMLDSAVDGNALLGGGRVDIGPGAVVSGKATLAGGLVRIDGHVDQGLRAVADTIIIAGEIGGDANLRANEIIILDTARIAGDLIYYSPQPIELSNKVSIGGDVAFIQSGALHEGKEDVLAFTGGIHFIWISGLILTVAVMIVAAPQLLPALNTQMKATRWTSVWIGFAVLIGGPVVIVLLIGIIFGLPLALILTTLYTLVLAIGYFASAFALGRKCQLWLKRQPETSFKGQFLSAAIGLVVLGFALVIPVVGVLANLIATVLGLSVLFLAFAARRKTA